MSSVRSKYSKSFLRVFSKVDVASSLEVLFLHPGVVFLTGGDAQGLVKRDTNHVVGVPQVAELGDLLKEVTDKAVNSWLEA
ncbi:unnamed protein product [Malus baccata var. baccata]